MEYDKNLYSSLEAIKEKYESLSKKLEDPNLAINEVTNINKTIKHIQPVYEKFLIFKKLIENGIQDEKVLSTNSSNDLIELAKLELEEIKQQIPSFEKELKILLIPHDKNDDKNVIVEMRPGVGGDESCIFVANLFDTYKRYADKQG